jgi:multiple sugar transport system substrate-binding protein
MEFFGSQSFPWSEISKFFTSAMQGAFGKTKTAQEALDGFVTEANRALSYY